MKILIASSIDSVTGAARAAARLHRLQVRGGQDSTMLVGHRNVRDWRILGPEGSFEKVRPHVMPRMNAWLMRLQRSDNQILHSTGWFDGPALGRIQRQPADVLNLHWVNDEFLSIRQIGRLDKPTVWTLHDSWAFSGAEHYVAGPDDRRFIDGYLPTNRGRNHHGVDIDRWAWRRKLKHWRRPMSIVAPSQWLADCARNSRLMRDWPIAVVPNALPLNVYKPWGKDMGREIFGLPKDRPLVLFGAVGGMSSPIKGGEYLRRALKILGRHRSDVCAVVLGQWEPKTPEALGMEVFYTGHLFDDSALAVLYSAVDVVVVPSRLENLPQIATEAQSCGIPVVAFDVGGMRDAVEDRRTGYLAEAYDAEDLAAGMVWALEQNSGGNALGLAARERAERIWNEQSILQRYRAVYNAAVEAAR